MIMTSEEKEKTKRKGGFMLYELSDQQQKALLTLISNANIKGADAPIVVQIAQALQKPKKEEPKEE